MLATLRKFPNRNRKQYSFGVRTAAFAALALAVGCFAPALAGAQAAKPVIKALAAGSGTAITLTPNVNASNTTYHNNNQRTGLNPTEIAFTLGPNSNPGRTTTGQTNFGKLWSRPVDGTIYTQPLFVPNVLMPNVPDILNRTTKNGVYNAVFVCTTHNSVYAFDAGGSARLTTPTLNNTSVRTLPLWTLNFNFKNAQIGPVQTSDIISEDLLPEIGITGTPVIDVVTDPATGRQKGTMYVVVKTKEGGNFAQRIHAIDITTGKETKTTLINVSVSGGGDGSISDPVFGSAVPFDALWANQQAALTLANGIVYVATGSHGNNGPYHGWMLAYSTPDLKLVGAFNTSPDADSSLLPYPGGAGIWMGGSGPAVDQTGTLFFTTGTGLFDASPTLLGGGRDYGNSVLKLGGFGGGGVFGNGDSIGGGGGGGGIDGGSVLDFFTPSNWEDLSTFNVEFGSGGIVLLPDVGNPLSPNLAVVAGTEGTIFLLDRDFMGQFNTNFNAVVQEIPNAVGPMFGIPAYFNNTLYFQGTGDFLKAFQFQNGVLDPTPVSQSGFFGSGQFGFPGSSPIVTSAPDGSNGIVWTLERFVKPAILPGFGIPDPTPNSVIHAYNAANLSNELYNTLIAGSRDLTSSAVYTSLTVANGRAYVGGVNEVVTFGNFVDNGITAKPNEADHYIITGANQVSQKAGNWYSITAIGPDNNPINLTGNVHLSYRNPGGPAVNINTITFNGASNVLFNYAFPLRGGYQFYANDDSGHSTFVPNIDLMPPGTLFDNIFVIPSATAGPDHLIITAPSQVKAGSTVNVKVQVVTATNTAYTWRLNGANFFFPTVGTSVTQPQGTQGAIPFLPVYAYSNGPNVPFLLNTSSANVNVRIPGVGNHVIVVEGTVSFFFGPDPANPTLVISYPVSGTAKIVAVP